MKTENTWNSLTAEQLAELDALCEDYKGFISRNKTERECVTEAVALAEAEGYRNLADLVTEGAPVTVGAKVYANVRGKALVMFNVGSLPLEQGLNILGAHLDCPRLDVKQNPLYEKGDLAYLDTHYYGGLKSMLWVATPLAIHGVVAKKDGTVVPVAIGDNPDDPVFCISDLLIHLAGDQMKKPLAEAVEHEQLDVIVGGRPVKIEADKSADMDSDAKEPVRTLFMDILAEQLGIEEEDLLSAELEVVPAGPARDMGLDRSMVLGFGQDDRVCSYTSLRAILDVPAPERTSACLLVDKEEIGSVGATGMEANYFQNALAELMELAGEGGELKLRRSMANSRMLSSDVSAGFDPTFADRFEEKNAAIMGHGFCFNKYVGSRGKGMTNDADAEYIAYVRRVMSEADVRFQMCELGRVNAGGGGTIALYMARYGMSVIDAGVPVLSMHSLWEVANKADIYEAYRGYKAFLEARW